MIDWRVSIVVLYEQKLWNVLDSIAAIAAKTPRLRMPGGGPDALCDCFKEKYETQTYCLCVKQIRHLLGCHPGAVVLTSVPRQRAGAAGAVDVSGSLHRARQLSRQLQCHAPLRGRSRVSHADDRISQGV